MCIRLTRLVIFALVLGVFSAGVLAWGLPLLALWAGWGKPATIHGPAAPTSGDSFWADDADGWARGGHYVHDHRALVDTVDFRRIIFMGTLAQQPFYRRDPPPRWASVLSIDAREGFEEVVTVAQGWPWRCVRGELWIDWTPEPAAPFSIQILPGGGISAAPAAPPVPNKVVGGRLVTRGSGAEFLVPLQVKWGMLLANVGVLTAAWSVLLIVPGFVRRAVRRRRGRCSRCGYDRRGLAIGVPCPECGAGEQRKGALV